MQYATLDDFLTDLPALTEPVSDKLRGHDNLFKLELTSGRSVFIRLEDGRASVTDSAEDYPACIVRTDEQLALDLVCGRTNPMKALLFGKVSVQGDVKPLLSLCALL